MLHYPLDWTYYNKSSTLIIVHFSIHFLKTFPYFFPSYFDIRVDHPAHHRVSGTWFHIFSTLPAKSIHLNNKQCHRPSLSYQLNLSTTSEHHDHFKLSYPLSLISITSSSTSTRFEQAPERPTYGNKRWREERWRTFQGCVSPPHLVSNFPRTRNASFFWVFSPVLCPRPTPTHQTKLQYRKAMLPFAYVFQSRTGVSVNPLFCKAIEGSTEYHFFCCPMHR